MQLSDWTHVDRRSPAAPIAVSAFAILLVGALLQFARFGEPAAAQDPLRVVATTGQIGDLLGIVGGDRVQVTTLMGPGVDPHLYKASEGDVQTLAEADAIFYNGLNLEGKMGEILERLGDDRPVVAVAEAIPTEQLRQPPEFEGNYDPHVWFDVSLWVQALARVEQGLAEIDPDGTATFETNAAAYRTELETLDAYAKEQIALVPPERRVLITAHDAFGYFGQRYGIEVVGLQGISTETEAGIDDVQRVAQLIVDRQVKAIFVETSVSPRTVEAVQAAVRDQGGEVAIGGQLYSDALGNPDTPAATYAGMFRSNVDTIVAGLR